MLQYFILLFAALEIISYLLVRIRRTFRLVCGISLLYHEEKSNVHSRLVFS